MPTVYVLINCDLGTEDKIVDEIKKLPDIQDVCRVVGVYDILVKLRSDKADRLKETITWKLRRIENIRATLTIIANEGFGTPKSL